MIGRWTHSGDCKKPSTAGARGQAEEQQKEEKDRDLGLYLCHRAAAENFEVGSATHSYLSSQQDYQGGSMRVGQSTGRERTGRSLL